MFVQVICFYLKNFKLQPEKQKKNSVSGARLELGSCSMGAERSSTRAQGQVVKVVCNENVDVTGAGA